MLSAELTAERGSQLRTPHHDLEIDWALAVQPRVDGAFCNTKPFRSSGVGRARSCDRAAQATCNELPLFRNSHRWRAECFAVLWRSCHGDGSPWVGPAAVRALWALASRQEARGTRPSLQTSIRSRLSALGRYFPWIHIDIVDLLTFRSAAACAAVMPRALISLRSSGAPFVLAMCRCKLRDPN